MKVRNVKIIADLKGMDKKYQPLYLKTIENMAKVLESSHWDNSWNKILPKYKTRLEGELNPKVKKMNAKDLTLLIFNQIEYDDSGKVWHVISDYDIRTYNGPSNVIGYGLTTDDITRVNIAFLVKDNINSLSDLKDCGANLIHEKFHDRGCKHDFEATLRRPNSAAYLAGTVYNIAYDALVKEGAFKTPATPKPKPIVETPIDKTQVASIIQGTSHDV